MDNILLIDEVVGVYIPQEFAKIYGHNILGKDNTHYYDLSDDLVILKEGPEHSEYWEAWEEVLKYAKIRIDGPRGNETIYTLHQDGDLWAVPEEG